MDSHDETEQQQRREEPPLSPGLRRKQTYILMVVALLGAVIAGVLLASTVWQWKWNTGPSPAPQATAGIDPLKACASQSAFDAIKQQLFQRSAQIRARNEVAFARIADFSLLRIDSPSVLGVDDQQHRVDCSGTAVLQLPPQITVGTGGNMLSSPIDYSVQLGAGGSINVVAIGNTDSIVTPLSTIASLAPPTPLTAPGPTNEMTPALGNEAQPSAPGVAVVPSGNEIETLPPPAQPPEAMNEQQAPHS